MFSEVVYTTIDNLVYIIATVSYNFTKCLFYAPLIAIGGYLIVDL